MVDLHDFPCDKLCGSDAAKSKCPKVCKQIQAYPTFCCPGDDTCDGKNNLMVGYSTGLFKQIVAAAQKKCSGNATSPSSHSTTWAPSCPKKITTSLLPELAVSTPHYEDPKPNGCRSDEQAIQIQGLSGDFCTPKCSGMTCPSDVPAGVTATPTCALQDTSGNKYCALLCSPSKNDACGSNASCKSISGVGICTYDD